MKRNIIVVLCLFALIMSLLPLSVTAGDDPYFIAINDELPELNLETEPIRINGVTYLPCTIFDRRIGGAILGVYYGWDKESETVSIYSKSQTLEFNMTTGTAYSYDKDKEYNYVAVMRNGMAYVPASSTCKYFGLDLSFPATDDASVQIVRIKNGNQVLDDRMFLSSAKPHLDDRSNKNTQNGGNDNSGSTIIKPVTPDKEPEGEVRNVYLAMRVDNATDLSSVLDALSGNGQVKTIFFFPISRLIDCDELLREVTGRGHRIGLIPQGDTSSAQMASLEEGNRLLKHILRQEAVFVLQETPTEDQNNVLKKAGYLPFTPKVTVRGGGRSDGANYQLILELVREKQGKVRLLLDDLVKGGTLSSALRQLREAGDQLHSIKETDF